MNRNQSKRRTVSRGFSLIEVLIAVVVLSVGLLALGALQASLVRNSSETKARSGALALAEEQLENYRSFGSGAEYRTAIVDGTEILLNSQESIDASRGGVDYTRSTTVERFAFNRDTGQFVDITGRTSGTTAPLSALEGTGENFINGREFKRVDVEVEWQDPVQGARTVRVNDVISAASPEEAAQVMRPRKTGNASPRVLITNPENIDGVIPIAIGDGSDTAATNPRPEVAGQGNNQAVIETRFEVLTYKGLGNASDLAQVQARVETVVVGCTCANTTGTGTGYRPTYWNGVRYVAPELTTTAPPAVHSPGGGNAPPQSPHCTACCRDHHDDSGVTGPKFSPRRSSHTHDIVGGKYTEACRLIRVDGIIHTAADMSNDYFNLLATANDGDTSPPSAAASTSYENFVLKYLGDRMVTGTAYNTLPAPATVQGYETTYNINDPATLEIQSSGDSKWLHSRGFYIDYLEDDAITAITTAKAATNCQGTAKDGCVLRRVPFTSINLTELSNWTPNVGTQIVVTNSDFRDSIASNNPVRGRVNSVAATAGTSPVATGSIMNSNAGVALIINQINGESMLSDVQQFQVTGSGTPGGTAGTFRFDVTGYPWNDISTNAVPSVLFTLPLGSSNVCNYVSQGNTDSYSCSTTDISGAISLSVRSYNFEDEENYPLNCTNTTTGTQEPLTCDFPICRNFTLQSVTGGTVASPIDDGYGSETTAVSFTSVADAAILDMIFSEGTARKATTCSFTPGNNNNASCNSAATNDPCLP